MGDNIAAGLIVGGLTFATGGTFLTLTGFAAAAAVGGITVAASFILQALAPSPDVGGFGEGAEDYRIPLRAEVVPARWIYGRARLAGALVHYSEFGPQGEEAEAGSIVMQGAPPASAPLRHGPYSEAHLIFALSEGDIDAIERIWVNGTEMPFRDNRGILLPSQNVSGDVQWRTDSGQALIAFFTHRGSETHSRSAMHRQFRWYRGRTSYKRDTHQFRGVSCIGVVIRAGATGEEWPALPSFEFLVRGQRITWPGQARPVWTDNAAAIRFHYLHNVKSISEILIDEASVMSAVATCESRDYRIDGVVSDADSYDAVIDQMDRSWAGVAPEINGRVVFRPGVPVPPSITIREDDLAESDQQPVWQLDAPIEQYADALDGQLAASRDHDYLGYTLARVGGTGEILLGEEGAEIVEDFGTLRFVSSETAAIKLLQIVLAQRQNGRRVRLSLVPGRNFLHYTLVAGQTVLLDLPTEGFPSSTDVWYIERSRIDFATGELLLDLVFQPPGLYDPTAPDGESLRPDDLLGHGVHNLDPPTGVRLEQVISPGDTSRRDIRISADQSLDGSALQARYRFSADDSEPWNYGGYGAGLRGIRDDRTIYVSVRYVGSGFLSRWTTPQEVGLASVFLEPDRDLPIIGFSGRQESLPGTEVSGIFRYTLTNSMRSVASVTLTGLPPGITYTHDPDEQTITLAGTLPDEPGVFTLMAAVTDNTAHQGRSTVELTVISDLALVPPGELILTAGIDEAHATLVVQGGMPPYTFSLVDPSPDFRTPPVVSSQGVLSGGVGPIGIHSITARVTDSRGSRSEQPVSILVQSAAGFGFGETEPLVFEIIGFQNLRYFIGGAISRKFATLDSDLEIYQQLFDGFPTDAVAIAYSTTIFGDPIFRLQTESGFYDMRAWRSIGQIELTPLIFDLPDSAVGLYGSSSFLGFTSVEDVSVTTTGTANPTGQGSRRFTRTTTTRTLRHHIINPRNANDNTAAVLETSVQVRTSYTTLYGENPDVQKGGKFRVPQTILVDAAFSTTTGNLHDYRVRRIAKHPSISARIYLYLESGSSRQIRRLAESGGGFDAVVDVVPILGSAEVRDLAASPSYLFVLLADSTVERIRISDYFS